MKREVRHLMAVFRRTSDVATQVAVRQRLAELGAPLPALITPVGTR